MIQDSSDLPEIAIKGLQFWWLPTPLSIPRRNVGYHDIFRLEVGYRDPGVKAFGLEPAIFPVGNQFIEVVSPIRENTAGGRYLDRRGGDGGYMVILQSDDHAPRKRRVAELGIRKVMEHDEG